MRQQAAHGRTAKHTAAGKHGGTGKHHPRRQRAAPATTGRKQTAVAKHPAHPKPRALALGGLPCCAAESVAASARLAGWRVTDAATLELFRRTDGPATIPATLEAAYRYGLAGVRPVGFGPLPAAKQAQEWLPGPGTNPGQGPALILGVELPGPHAVTVAGDGCWLSWGGHYDPAGWPEAVVEEAWVVAWP